MRTAGSRRETPDPINPHRARHLSLQARNVLTDEGVASVLVNDGESPLAWLARRKGRDGRSMISPQQFIAGEKLRADFTRGNMAPRVTANWSAPTGGRPRGSGLSPGDMTDVMITSRQKVGQALDACGPEFSGLLMDVCCFLRGLEDIERERSWPARSAKVVLQLGLDRLARHYGLADEAKGRSAKLRTWLAEDAAFEV
ncbi:DNA replication protein [Tardiphaga alba]|uniref:DNA replication protein n=1 Tax=Tardiphaga alba TaxID=340268 RepID=A0ABX8A9B2_9BRAD|nr:DUF6456 domain-containing protein [Tardiphaga alba]QUS39259.1 DNA replication protein [Tardiphaga alba]